MSAVPIYPQQPSVLELGAPGGAVPALADLYAPIEEELARVCRLFDDTLVGDLPFLNDLCDHVRGYRGKMLRPALLLLTGRAVGELTEEHIALGVVVEMIHLATLLHDDVLDCAEIRRRRPTVSALRGNETSVLLGDYLVSHAYHLCSSVSSGYAACRIGATSTTMCEGELMQIHHRGNCNLTEAEYLDIIDRKTAALTAVCGELGAQVAGGSPETVKAMASFGRAVGIAFQIIDDVLDLIGTEKQMGKTLGRDLDLGKPTLPAIHCLSRGDASVAAKLAAVLGDGSSTSRRDVRDWLHHTGSIQYAMERATEYIARARSHIEPLPPSPAKESLSEVARFMVRRRR